MLLALAALAVAGEPTPVNLAPHLNANLAGKGGLLAELPNLAGLPTAPSADKADAVALKSPAFARAPRRVDLAIDGRAGRLFLLAALDRAVPLGTPVARVHFTYADGRTEWVDLRAGSDIFPLEGGGSSGTARAVPVGRDRTISLVSVASPRADLPITSVGLESRGSAATVFVAAAAVGDALEVVPESPLDEPRATFAFPLSLGSVPPPVPPAFAVPPNTRSRGKVRVADGHLVYADGSRARFWGINLLNEACYPTHETADALARHLAGNGFNLVRLHHCDSDRARGLRANRAPGEDPLDPAAMDRLDYLVAKLGEAGIYVFLEVATNRAFTAADGVSAPGPEVPNGHKLLPIYQDDWRAAYLRWTQQWLGRTNPYTKLRYADDPTIAVVELANEHSLFVSWLTGSVERLPAVHRAALDAAWNRFVSARYPDDAALVAAWTGSVNPGLRPGETRGAVGRFPSGQGTFSSWPQARVADMYDFHLALERAFFADVARTVRELGFTVPLVANVTFGQPTISSLVGEYDLVDIHLQWDDANDTLRNDSILANPRGQNLPDRFREAQVGKPFSVSELNHSFPNAHAHEAPLFWATMASVQDWDVLVWLNYTNGAVVDGPGPVSGPTELRFAGDRLPQMALASGLFRSGAVKPAPGSFTTWRSPAQVKAEVVEGRRTEVLHTRDVRFLLSHLVRDSFAGPPTPSKAGIPNGDVGWWVDAGRMVVTTPGVDAVLGHHGRRLEAGRGEGAGPVAAAHLDPQLDGPAAVSLACLSGPSLDGCDRAILSVVGAASNAGMRTTGGGATVLDTGHDEARLSRPSGSVRFTWRGKPTVRPLGVDGKRGEPLAVRPSGTGWWTVDLEAAGPTVWWTIGD